MWAICQIKGKQYIVKEGDRLVANRIKDKDSKGRFVIDKVLLVVDEKSKKIEIGRPFLSSWKIQGKVLVEKKGPKVIIFKYKRRKGYHKKQGFRPLLSEVLIEKIIKAPSKK